MNKYIELARKLRELWLRGEENERQNAEQKLKALLEKHGMTLEDIEGDAVEMRAFQVTPKDIDIFTIMVANVLGSEWCDKICTKNGDPLEGVWYLPLNSSDYIELEAKYEFFKAAFYKEYTIMLKAFVYKQDIYAKDAEEAEPRLPTEEDIMVTLAARAMMKQHFRKQLNSGNFGIE